MVVINNNNNNNISNKTIKTLLFDVDNDNKNELTIGNFQTKKNTLERINGGINWFVASILLITDMAGGGIVAMPVAIINSSMF